MVELEELVLNPHAEVRVCGSVDAPSCVMVSAARRGVPRMVTSVEPSADFGLFPLLLRIARADEPFELALSDEQTAFLEQAGLLVEPEMVSESVRFTPRLDRALLAAVPRRSRSVTPSLSELVRAPGVAVQWTDEPPAALPPCVQAAFAQCAAGLSPPLVWVRDARTEVWCAYEADRALAELLAHTGEGEAPAAPLDMAEIELLVYAQILVPAGSSPALVPRCREAFAAADHAVAPGLLPPLQVAALRRYYEAKVRGGFFGLGDSLVERRFVAHNEPVARFFLAQLAAFVSAVVGEPVRPSYVFFARYLPGAVLPKHVDREQCEYSISFQLDYSPEPEATSPWPLFLENAGSTDPVALHLGLGDGLLYVGRRQPHFRRRLPKGHASTSLFFHFVREDFDGSLD